MCAFASMNADSARVKCRVIRSNYALGQSRAMVRWYATSILAFVIAKLTSRCDASSGERARYRCGMSKFRESAKQVVADTQHDNFYKYTNKSDRKKHKYYIVI